MLEINEFLTDTQITRKVISATKAWLKENGYSTISFRYIRGTYHFNNCNQYITAAFILRVATGLRFIEMGIGMAKLDKNH